MKCCKLPRLAVGLALILSLAAACGAPESASTPAPTSTPPPTAPPTATPTPPTGQIVGRIIGADSQRSQADLQIVLCLLSPATEGEPESCSLQDAPSAVSDADGVFELHDILAGSYILVFGRPDDEVSPAEDWAGLDVTTGQLCVASLTGKRYVCSSEEVAFWAEGGDVLTGQERLTIGDDGKVEFFGVLEGIVRSRSVGLSVMIQDTALAPVVHVRAGETTEVDWQLVGR